MAFRTAWRAATASRKLMKPGPAISAAATISWVAGLASRVSTICCASSRGLRPAGLANCIATLQATSPWAATLGRSRRIVGVAWGWMAPTAARSEEHTSELQSLMRISYAVFCLKKKTKNNKSELQTYYNVMSVYNYKQEQKTRY